MFNNVAPSFIPPPVVHGYSYVPYENIGENLGQVDSTWFLNIGPNTSHQEIRGMIGRLVDRSMRDALHNGLGGYGLY